MPVVSAALQCSDGLCGARYEAWACRFEELARLFCRFCASSLELVPGEAEEVAPVETASADTPQVTLIGGPLGPRTCSGSEGRVAKLVVGYHR